MIWWYDDVYINVLMIWYDNYMIDIDDKLTMIRW